MNQMRKGKLQSISAMLDIKDIKQFIFEQYKSGMSYTEIQEWFNGKCAPYVTISNRAVSQAIKDRVVTRDAKRRFINAIERGRMTYKTTDKPFRRKGISLKQRFKILQRDEFKCKACGDREYLEIDHIIPIERGGSNNDENLQTLCRACNYGKCMNESERFKNTK